MVVGGPALEVSLSAARSGGDELPSLSPLTQSRLSAIQLEQSLQSSHPGTPQAAASPLGTGTGSPGTPTPDQMMGSRTPGGSSRSPSETEEEKELREAFELDEMLVCGVGLGELLRCAFPAAFCTLSSPTDPLRFRTLRALRTLHAICPSPAQSTGGSRRRRSSGVAS